MIKQEKAAQTRMPVVDEVWYLRRVLALRETLSKVKRRYWIAIAVVVILATAWTFVVCPVLHHRVGWCPMGHSGAGSL